MLASHPDDAAILDLGVPDGDGLHLLAELRARGDAIPILVPNAGDADDQDSGLDTGAGEQGGLHILVNNIWGATPY